MHFLSNVRTVCVTFKNKRDDTERVLGTRTPEKKLCLQRLIKIMEGLAVTDLEANLGQP